jgi:hypothetical protein
LGKTHLCLDEDEAGKADPPNHVDPPQKSPLQSAVGEISLCGTARSKAQTKSEIENPKSDRKILKVSAAAAAVP